MIRIGVDTGGTFTDLVKLDDTGLRVHKLPSTPEDPAIAILAGIAELLRTDVVDEVIHGSTVATNAILERKGSRIALLTTRGFEDVLRIGRQTRSRLYDFQVKAPRQIVEPEDVFGVEERVDHEGNVVVELASSEILRLVDLLVAGHYESVAICLLHSYANPAHERQLKQALAAAGINVSPSHEILPEYREFERWSTTAVNAYVTPIMAKYLKTLEAGLSGTRLHIMQSNGGTISARQASHAAVRTVLSGPAAGAVGAQAIARASGFDRIVLFDMGGTSTDVSLVDGQLGTTKESTVGDFPVRLPMLDIHTVGAGGGSIVYIDGGGSLRVGPRSAGANPGPVCYGRGEELTTSDANLLLGRLPVDQLLGGRLSLDAKRTRSYAEVFANKLGISVERLAEGIVQIANANMEHAIRAVSVQRGYDPRDFALLAFGGAGGMHACEIAEKLEMDTVLVPRHAGVLSALGMLLADVRKDYAQTILRTSRHMSFEALRQLFRPMEERAQKDMEAEGFAAEQIVVECLLEVRYRGQAYEILIPLTEDFEEAFHAKHAMQYGYSNCGKETEIVNLRVNVVGVTKKALVPASAISATETPAALRFTTAWFGSWCKTPIYEQTELKPGMQGDGPAVIAGTEATVVVPPSFNFSVDAMETLILKRRASDLSQAEDRAFAEENR